MRPEDIDPEILKAPLVVAFRERRHHSVLTTSHCSRPDCDATPHYKLSLSARMERELRMGFANLATLGVCSADRRRVKTPISFPTVLASAVATRAEKWEHAGYLPHLLPFVPAAAEWNDRVKDSATRDRLPGKRIYVPQDVEAYSAMRMFLFVWQTRMVHIPHASNHYADVLLDCDEVTQSDPSLGAMALDRLIDFLLGPGTPFPTQLR